jgi:hypothetical protein
MSNLSNSKINENIQSQKNLNNIKYFLESYESLNDLSKISYYCKKNKKIFSEKSLIPESYKNTKIPFNRNNAFYELIKSYNKDENPNLFPQNPIKLSEYCDLEKINKKQILSKKVNFNEFTNKIWSIEINYKSNSFYYGLYSTEKIYSFLNEVYSSMTNIQKESYIISIIDMNLNVRYSPDLLYLTLKNNYENEEKVNSNLENNFLLDGKSELNQNENDEIFSVGNDDDE